MSLKRKSKPTFKVLKKTKFARFKKDIYGFDIETCNKNKTFVCASITGENGYWKLCRTKKEVIKEFKHIRYRNSVVVASNLQFDLMGFLFGNKEMRNFKLCFRGSQLIFAKTHLYHKEFCLKRPKGYTACSITFLDTFNYAALSVESLGKLIGYKKLKKPGFLGKNPNNKAEWGELIEYNRVDAEISMKGLRFLFDSFEKMGASPKFTIAATAMSLFKNKYIGDNQYYVHDKKLLREQFKAYYGGRVEVFKRGRIKETHYYYDFNSLYPSVMRDNVFPDPNSVRENTLNNIMYIERYEGISHVDVYCPETLNIPLLPCKYDNKLLFPTGSFSGWYTNVELRKAMSLGYVIRKVYKNIYFKEKCCPFRGYVDELYGQRMNYKSNNNDSMQFIVKILMNSLYGKFGQKFWDMDNWVRADISHEDLMNYSFKERYGDFFRVKSSKENPANFCFPIWACYVTAYARIKLYDVISKCDPVYCDTDSIVTTKKYVSSAELGELKVEYVIKEGLFVRPKFYGIITDDGEEYVKVKGLGSRLTFKAFNKLVDDGMYGFDKFTKFKEAVRRNLVPNELIFVMKNMSVEDNKRLWSKKYFDSASLQLSKALFVVDGVVKDDYEEQIRKSTQWYDKEIFEEFIEDSKDFFDSKGDDITDSEFMKNEMSEE